MSSGLKRTIGFAVSLAALLCVGHWSRLRAESPVAGTKEVREFDVLLKGKPTGTTTFTIEQFPGGRTVVTTDAVVRVNLVVYTYNYEFHGTENWVTERLESFNNHGTDGTKKFTLSGAVSAGKSKVVLNQKTVEGPAYTITSNYWRLPLRTARGEALNCIDASTGAAQRIRVSAGSAAQVPFGDVMIPATEYHLTGDVDVKLWLDHDGRIVRQQSVEQGYPTELKLTRISSAAGAMSAR